MFQYKVFFIDFFVVDDCLQYFTGLSGTIRNFNYDATKDNSALATANTHLSNQDYNICFRFVYLTVTITCLERVVLNLNLNLNFLKNL